MKTILIAHNYTENSFAAMSYHLAHHLANLGHKVVFISFRPYFAEPQDIITKNGKIIVCSWPTKNRPTSLSDFIWFSKMYLKYKPEIIIGHFVGSNITASVSKLMSLGKTKTFVYYHTLSSQILTDGKKQSFKQTLLKLRKKFFYQLFCDVLVCPSSLAKKDLSDYYAINKGVVVLNPMTDRFREKINISNDKIIVSFLGRLDLSKGVIELVAAFKLFLEKVPTSKMILNIAGSGSQQAEIIKLIKQTPSINYLGALSYDKIDEYINESHFTIIPSKFDNLPTVGLESMMNATPILISNTTGLTEYLTEGKECFKFDANIADMVKLFEKIENNFELHKQMSIDARATFLNKFSIEEYCNQFSKIIL
ncbi:MAG: glycosyltransferase family 4 protein [Lutibacter sp.]